MNKYHQELLKELKIFPQVLDKDNFWHNAYIGSKKISYKINAVKKKEIIKNWLKKHPQLAEKEFIKLLHSLYNGQTHTEISFAGKLLEYAPKLRKGVKPPFLDSWLTKVEGWAEVDSLCQSNFTAGELLSNWLEWKQLITKLSQDKNIHKRRASLVLLTNPVRKCSDKCLSELAFSNIDKLKSEEHILITKAISWLLRSLIEYHRKEVKEYIEKNAKFLPKIAIRETTNKLRTGKK